MKRLSRGLTFLVVLLAFVSTAAIGGPIIYGLNGYGGVYSYDAATGAGISGWNGSLNSSGSIVLSSAGIIYGLNGNGGVTGYDAHTGAGVSGWNGDLNSSGSIVLSSDGIIYGLNGYGGVSGYDANTGVQVAYWTDSLNSIGDLAIAPERSIPEPATFALLGLGLAGLVVSRSKECS